MGHCFGKLLLLAVSDGDERFVFEKISDTNVVGNTNLTGFT